LYKCSDSLTFGLAYTSESNLEDLEADNASLELSPFAPGGPALLRYNKAEIIDLQQPSNLAFGIAYQPTKKLVTLSLNNKTTQTSLKSWKCDYQRGPGRIKPLQFH